MKHKLFVLVAALAVSLSAAATEYFTAVNSDGVSIVYSINDNEVGVAKLLKADSDELYPANVVIPESVTNGDKTYPVTAIDEEAFYGTQGLVSVTIPNTVVSIGAKAFEYTATLTTINVGNSVKTVGPYAFYGCSSLSAFYGKLASDDHRCLIIDGVLTWFASCGVTSYTIPNTVQMIGERAFGSSKELKEVTIPESVINIVYSAFEFCTSLEAFHGKFATDDHRCLIAYGSLIAFARVGVTNYTIPETVLAIESYVFDSCTELKSITLPEKIGAIRACAFAGCTNLEEVILPGNPQYLVLIGEGAFQFCSSLKSIVLPDQIYSMGVNVFWGCSSLTSVNIPKSMTEIPNNTFRECSSLTSIDIHNSITKIGISAFQKCTSLTTVSIGNSVNSIETRAFNSCSALSSLTVHNDNPSNITLGGRVFGSVNSDCVLYVPLGCKDLYASADQWSQFANIVEVDMPDAGVGSVLVDEKESDATLYDLMGRPVSNPTPGLYIRNGHKLLLR